MIVMSNQEGILIDAPFPLVWMANYPISTKNLTVPTCGACGKPTRIDEDLCGCEADISFEGASTFEFDPSAPGVITEYDSEGQETIPFDLLPRENLVYFTLVDPCVNPTRFYTFDLRTGRFLVNQVPLGLAITTPADHGRDLGYISDISFVGKKVELFHSKHVEISMGGRATAYRNEFDEIMTSLNLDPSSSSITNIVAGYKYVYQEASETDPRLVAEARLSVDCETHVPYITARIYEESGPDETP